LKAQLTDSEEKKKVIVEAAEDKKANYVTTLDLRGKTLIADYFIICTGTSNVHIRSIADGIIEVMEKYGIRANAMEGYAEGAWVLLDYGDIVTHIMSESHRSFYKLEGLWSGKEEKTLPVVETVPAAAEA
jgi:ribosome-associated protein